MGIQLVEWVWLVKIPQVGRANLRFYQPWAPGTPPLPRGARGILGALRGALRAGDAERHGGDTPGDERKTTEAGGSPASTAWNTSL